MAYSAEGSVAAHRGIVMTYLLLFVAAVLSVAGLLNDSDALLDAGWAVWAVGVVSGALRWRRNRRRFASVEEAEAAAAAGNTRAMRFLASLRKLGGDHAEAERLLRAAVELGDVEAMWDMARLVDLRDSPQEAEPWFRMAGEHGHFFAKKLFRPGHAFNRDGSTPLEPDGGRTAPPGPRG
ncbi:sel1 repeat family protein [Streptomyces sp. NPDC051567]|uniref:sel1 repeat family protein n=1 Tax=Streptomyces sp. NPDC051567 TaxID=3365660 RepID=UPI00379E3054